MRKRSASFLLRPQMKMNCARAVTRWAISGITLDPWPPNNTRPVGKFGIEPKSGSLGRAIRRYGLDRSFGRRIIPEVAKIWSVRMSQRPRLLHRFLRSANQILILPFDPEMRRIIGEIRENCHQRRRRAGFRAARD